MRLTRRDALAALAAGGSGALAGCSALTESDVWSEGTEDHPVGDHEMATLVAIAEVVYPSAVDGVASFVRTYTGGRVDGDGAYATGVAEAVDALDEYTATFHDERYVALSSADRRETLDYMSVDEAEADPDGAAEQRVRYYLVNELLFAFYRSPTGAGMAGLENPPGYAGGTTSYREAPDR
ncbi:gluconate 2-dehydrogenase subunit 3 family protein [Halomarina salina]|uniref:Gluconate 2-dehydrogenase subunit 3 family protein n=1 Tax=Halomarina salina TaxID=1872699 RepID=A0ABD5RLW0_9EURY|nr:gluconate 2-dehydrogenase subunit 3 family protein [Halomarina salina]